ncbi:MAG: U3 snoRNP protein [Bathelium mastoideum]|nr:MAG: U3 snoRNP protein [Bathelium mastoideum]
MAAGTRGRGAKPANKIVKVKKNSTPSSNKHHFESFSQRIAKLNIDPVRRARHHDLDENEITATTSYFKASLEEWQDLNLTGNFLSFVRDVRPLSESLPQILHYQDRIVDTLIQYVGKEDSLSLEPLLALVAHLAHDLGTRFEKHFAKVVTAVSKLAAQHQSVEVIEWSFNCLAWLFKYLSKLLVPDLRPLYDLVAPLLGRERQKPFVAKFAAEAVSFLIRKAGAAYERDQVPLRIIVSHALEDLVASADVGDTTLYSQGLMTLFTGAMNGVQNGLHTSAASIIYCLTEQTLRLSTVDEDLTCSPDEVLLGVLTAVSHHADEESFQMVFKRVLQTFGADNRSEFRHTTILAEILFVFVTARKRKQDLDWSLTIDTAARLIGQVDRHWSRSATALKNIVRMFAVVITFAPFDSLIPHLRLIDTMSLSQWEDFFLSFCIYVADLDPERSKRLLLPHFQRFFLSNWDTHSERLCVALPLLNHKLFKLETSMTISDAIWRDISSSFQTLAMADQTADSSHNLLYQCNIYLELIEITKRSSSNHLDTIWSSLIHLLEHALQESCEDRVTDMSAFAAGRGLVFLASDPHSYQLLHPLWKRILEKSRKFKNVPGYLQAVLQHLESSADVEEETSKGEHVETLLETLLDCLKSPSHDLRLISLRILMVMRRAQNSSGNELLSIALSIEMSSFGIESLRMTALYLRKLASGYALASDTWLHKAITAYCFGLLHVRLTPLWEDVSKAFEEMSKIPVGEESIMQVAITWLQGGNPTDNEDDAQLTSDDPLPRDQALSDFEDLESVGLEARFNTSAKKMETSQHQLKGLFTRQNKPWPLRTDQCRTQALRVLNQVPAAAERWSRTFVPILLDWASNRNEEEAEIRTSYENFDQARWARKDQKAMLKLFSQFVNPKALYRSKDVHRALLALLCNGDVEIQILALKAILSWKQPSVKRYEEHLTNLLDDAKFREELATFLNVNQEDSELQEKDLDELMPVLLRLLYGRVISRTGSSSGGGQQAKRRAVFGILARLGPNVLAQFLVITLSPIHQLELIHENQLRVEPFDEELLSQRKQVGVLNMLEDILKELGTGLGPFASQLVDAVLYCVVRASRLSLASLPLAKDEETTNSSIAFPRAIRQIGMRCLNLLFEHCPDGRWDIYVPVIFRELVDPRLDKLAIESAQSPSGLWHIFSTWSKSLRYAPFLVSYNCQLIAKISELLGIPSAKDEVKIFVIRDIVENLVTLANAEDLMTLSNGNQTRVIRESILQPYATDFLTQLAGILKGSPSKDLLDAAVNVVSRLGPFVTGASNARTLVEISVFLLLQPSKRVRPHTKSGILEILDEFVPQIEFDKEDNLFKSICETIASLFGHFQDRADQKPNRTLLCNIFSRLAQIDDGFQEVAELCTELNAMSTKTLNEPDFNRRSHAFSKITEHRYKDLSAQQWKPLAYNLLFYIKDEDELTIRTNASYGLRRFVERAANTITDGRPAEGFESLISTALLPGIFAGIRGGSELVRIEYLSVLASVVREFPHWALVNDMQNLLVGDDEEASFFNNILHIQQHRRLRAIRRLGTEASSGILHSRHIGHFFVPLMEHFIFGKPEDENAHNLAAEAINTIRLLVAQLGWPQFRAVLQRYLGYLHNKPEEMKRTIIRLIGAVVDALDIIASKASPSSIHELVVGLILAPLTEYLHHKDESTVSLRIPVAVVVVKLLCRLSPEEVASRLPPVLMDICHILRSRDQGSRDMTRKTLAEIANIVGPAYFGFIIKELRSALLRGYQLHVLSFTLHSILIEAMASFKPGDVDYCLTEVVAVIMDDIFGVTGQEKDAEEYTSKMREVKSSKSFDSMELIAKVTTVNHLSKLVQPIQALLLERLNDKMVRKIDELLRRVGLGVARNEAVQDRDILVFCYEIIKNVYKLESSTNNRQQIRDYKTKRYLINMRGATKSGNRGSTSSYTYKLVRFSLDLLRSVLQKREELKTPSNLNGFMPMIGDALVGGQEEIQISAVRLLVAVVKMPLPQLSTNASLYVSEAVRIIKASPSTNSESSQAALKLVSAVLRERKDTQVRETDLAYLLEALLPDLREPDRQGVTFSFLRAILGRRIVMNEVYKIMDEVANIMVTNQTRGVRDTARGAYFQFLMEYPQGKKRLQKQLDFLCQNLDYQYAEGRQSVMELFHLLLSKTSDELVQEIIGSLFPFLMLRLNNDLDKDCQSMLEALTKKVFEVANASRLNNFISQLKSCMEQDQQPMLQIVALRVWALYLDERGTSTQDLQYIQDRVKSMITSTDTPVGQVPTASVLTTALATAVKLCKTPKTAMFSTEFEAMWSSVISLSFSPSVDIKFSAAQLLGLLFNDFARHNADVGLTQLPLTGSGGIQLDGEGLLQLMVASLRTMQSSAMDSEALTDQTVRNLVFLGRCLDANGMLWQPQPMLDSDTGENDEEEGAAECDEENPKKQMTALHYLLTHLSRIIRRNETILAAISPKLPALILLGALVNHLNPTSLTESLSVFLIPLNYLTDTSITHLARGSDAGKLADLAHEITDKVKNKVGMSAFVQNMEQVRGKMREKRGERRKKRALNKVTEEGMKRLVQAKKRKVDARKTREKEARATKGVVYKGKKRRLYE